MYSGIIRTKEGSFAVQDCVNYLAGLTDRQPLVLDHG
jgi:hypothetical protein